MEWEFVIWLIIGGIIVVFIFSRLAVTEKKDFLKEDGKYEKNKQNAANQFLVACLLATLYEIAVIYGAGSGIALGFGSPIMALAMIVCFLTYWVGRVFDSLIAQCGFIAFIFMVTFLPFLLR